VFMFAAAAAAVLQLAFSNVVVVSHWNKRAKHM